jgi:hypothetical protein
MNSIAILGENSSKLGVRDKLKFWAVKVVSKLIRKDLGMIGPLAMKEFIDNIE